MLDLQLCRISRPAHDLGYFFGSSTKPTFRKEHMKPLLQYYYDIFVKELKAYGYSQDIYSFEDLMEDVKECWPYGYCFAKLHTIVSIWLLSSHFSLVCTIKVDLDIKVYFLVLKYGRNFCKTYFIILS